MYNSLKHIKLNQLIKICLNHKFNINCMLHIKYNLKLQYCKVNIHFQVHNQFHYLINIILFFIFFYYFLKRLLRNELLH